MMTRQYVRTICTALINSERVTWPFGVDGADGVMAAASLALSALFHPALIEAASSHPPTCLPMT